jgi:hypothetical protein
MLSSIEVTLKLTTTNGRRERLLPEMRTALIWLDRTPTLLKLHKARKDHPAPKTKLLRIRTTHLLPL